MGDSVTRECEPLCSVKYLSISSWQNEDFLCSSQSLTRDKQKKKPTGKNKQGSLNYCTFAAKL